MKTEPAQTSIPCSMTSFELQDQTIPETRYPYKVPFSLIHLEEGFLFSCVFSSFFGPDHLSLASLGIIISIFIGLCRIEWSELCFF